VFEEEMKARIVRALSSPSIELLVMIGLILMALVAIWYMDNQNLEGTVLVMIVGALGASASSFRTLATLNNTLQTSAAAADRIKEVMELPSEQTARQEHTNPNLYSLERHRESVTFEDIVFTYPGCDAPTLKGLGLSVPVGSVCAIVGGNGSGKSTLLGLIPRLYEPDSGRVLIDGRDIKDATLRSLRRQMAVVTQDTVLFDGSIADNIIYGTRHATQEQMIEAARHAHAHEFIEQMPDGYATEIGERGARLSGGQRQRLAIARAILRDPAILILDEATSQIDADSEAKINEALEGFMANRTTFVIAHRLSTVVNADMIVVMNEGEIDSIGKHAELLESSEVYRTLCRTQMGGGD
jgi:ABC-type multidrug transport system fused ATPase/permease subunit